MPQFSYAGIYRCMWTRHRFVCFERHPLNLYGLYFLTTASVYAHANIYCNPCTNKCYCLHLTKAELLKISLMTDMCTEIQTYRWSRLYSSVITCAKPIMKCNVTFIVRSELCGFTLLKVLQFSGWRFCPRCPWGGLQSLAKYFQISLLLVKVSYGKIYLQTVGWVNLSLH